MKLKIKLKNISLLVLTACAVTMGCQKLKRPELGDYPKDTNPPGGPLKFYVAFDGTTSDPLMNAVDSIRANFPMSNPLPSVNGVNGKAAQGVLGKAIKYPSANDFKNATSFTLSWWMKDAPHTDGPAFLFSLTDKDYWSNSSMFLLIEDAGQSSAEAATVKFNMQDQWFEFTGANKMKNILNGSWHHIAIVYDQTTSKLTYYIDGTALTGLPSNLTDVKDGSNPRGAANLRNAGNLVLGGWNKHAGLDGPKDPWIQSYTGTLDQWRMYGKALTASEVQALYNSKL